MYAVKICSVPGCGGKHKAKGYCAKHYRRLQRQGHVEDTVGCWGTPYERLMRRVEWDGDCLVFTGSVNEDGYGTVRTMEGSSLTHRVVYEHVSGNPIPGDLLVCHHCDNPPCVNPDHLFLGTFSDNAQDRENKGRGNDISGDNNPKRRKLHVIR